MLNNNPYPLRAVTLGLCRLIRPNQWYKQAILLLGIFFSKNLFTAKLLVDCAIGIISFCAISSCVYAINDVFDVEEDRNHPVKQNRPVASGLISPKLAISTAFGLSLLSFWLGSLLNTDFLLVLVLYVVQNIAYNIGIKDVILADIIIIATGFALRAVAGVFAIGVSPSPWLVMCVFLLALALALSKRYHELTVVESTNSRHVLDAYTPDLIEDLLRMTATSLIISYSLYTVISGSILLVITIPTAIFATFRFYYLVTEVNQKPAPLNILTDVPFAANFLIHLTILFYILYLPKLLTFLPK